MKKLNAEKMAEGMRKLKFAILPTSLVFVPYKTFKLPTNFPFFIFVVSRSF